VKTTLNADGQIGIPPEIRQADQLAAGDSFELERLTPGHYLLAKQQGPSPSFVIAMGNDGLPVIRVNSGLITSQLVGEIEGQAP